MTLSATVIGARRLNRKLNRVSDDIADNVRREIRTGALELVAQMRDRVPVSLHKTHGTHLREQLQVRISKNGLRAKVGLTGALYRSTYFYGRFVEFGTRRMPKRPFIFNSWASLKGAISGNIREAVTKALEAASRRTESDA